MGRENPDTADSGRDDDIDHVVGFHAEDIGYFPGLDVELDRVRGKEFARKATAANLRRLPPRRAEAMTMRYWGGMTYREIADAMGITHGAARVMVYAARRNLERLT